MPSSTSRPFWQGKCQKIQQFTMFLAQSTSLGDKCTQGDSEDCTNWYKVWFVSNKGLIGLQLCVHNTYQLHCLMHIHSGGVLSNSLRFFSDHKVPVDARSCCLCMSNNKPNTNNDDYDDLLPCTFLIPTVWWLHALFHIPHLPNAKLKSQVLTYESNTPHLL